MIVLNRITNLLNKDNFRIFTSLNKLNYSSAIAMAFDEYNPKNSVTAPPLLVMHGLFGSKQNWRGTVKSMLDQFNPSRKIYVLDARNHGESPKTGDHNYKLMSADIMKFLQDKQISKCSLLGHSMGGKAMMCFLLLYPDMVERTVIVDISPISIPRDFTYYRTLLEAMEGIPLPNDMSLGVVRKAAEDILHKITNKGLTAFLLQNLKKENDKFMWALNLPALKINIENVGNIPNDIIESKTNAGPILFIGGTRDDYITKDEWPAIQKIFPNGEIVWLDSGHLIHIEKPADFVKISVDFMNKV